MTNITLTPQQNVALDRMKGFVQASDEKKVFILRGYAGTGKTTLMKAFTDWLKTNFYKNGIISIIDDRLMLSQQFIPLASTGRAAKVLADKIHDAAHTVHSWIYLFDDFNQDLNKVNESIETHQGIDHTGDLLLDFKMYALNREESPCPDAKIIYIIDEASMLSDTPQHAPTQAKFGIGRTLKDLLDYDPQGKFIFIGDECQLPPILSKESPALSADYFKKVFDLQAETVTLTEVMRQSGENDLLQAATGVRRFCVNPPQIKWARFPLRGYHNVRILSSQIDLLNQYANDVKQHGYTSATLITYSNNSCLQFAHALRKQLGFNKQQLMPGELLLVTQNNHTSSLSNGDLVEVVSIGLREQHANLTFLHIEVKDSVYQHPRSVLLIENLLYSGTTNLTQPQQKALFVDFFRRMKKKNVETKTPEFIYNLANDPYLNALRAVFGYAITCHKSQGGEWPRIYLDIPRRLAHCPTRDTFRWLYTAMTRASETLFVADDFFIQ